MIFAKEMIKKHWIVKDIMIFRIITFLTQRTTFAANT